MAFINYVDCSSIRTETPHFIWGDKQCHPNENPKQ